MRFLVTALPSFLVTVNPKRAAFAVESAGRSRASIKKAGVETRLPPRTARKSARFLRVSMAVAGCSKPKAACGPWRGGAPGPSDRLPSASACGSRGGACARCGWADRCVSRNVSARSWAARRTRAGKLILIFPRHTETPKSPATRPAWRYMTESRRFIWVPVRQVNAVRKRPRGRNSERRDDRLLWAPRFSASLLVRTAANRCLLSIEREGGEDPKARRR